MLALLSCPQGHFWEAVNDEEASSAPPVCPVCGAAAESIPLLDLAPSEPAAEPAPVPPPPPPLRDDKGRPVVAGYEVSEAVGRGPTGVAFYRARQVLVNRPVLLKVVYAREDTGQVAWGGLRGEAGALGRLSHPNIVQVFEAGERDRQLFYNAVEWVEGPTLAALAAEKPLPARQAAALVEVLARAVHHAHEKGVVHRSLKPASVLLQPVSRGESKKDPGLPPAAPPYCEIHGSLCLPKITDWGLARRPVEGDVNDAELQGEHPYYLSPEQAWGRAKEIGPPADVHALGVVLYELLAGRPPFREATPMQTLDAIQCREAAPPSRWQRVHADLDAVCRRCLAKQPRRRYASALELADDLRRWLDGRPVTARQAGAPSRAGRWVRRRFRAIAAFGLGMLACWGLFALARPSGRAPTTYPVATRIQQELAQLRATNNQTLQREQEALYCLRINQAERALEDRDRGRAGEVLDACPANQRRWEWHHLKRRQGGQEVRNEILGPARVTTVAFSPESELLAMGGEYDEGAARRGDVAIWRLRDMARVLDVPDPTGPVRRLAFSPDGFRLALLLAGPQRTNLLFVDARTGRLLPGRAFAGSRPTDLAYSPDGTRLLLAEEGGTVRLMLSGGGGDLWSHNLHRLQVVRPPPGPYGRVVPLSQDGGRFAAVTPDGWQLVVGTGWQGVGNLLSGSTDLFLALASHPGTDRVATGGRDHVVRVWNVSTGRSVDLRGHRSEVTGLAWSPDGGRLASCSRDGTVRLWDPASGLEVLTLKGLDGEPRAVAFSPDGARLAVAHGGKATVWSGEAEPDVRNPFPPPR